MGEIKGLCDRCGNRGECYYLKKLMKPIVLVSGLKVTVDECLAHKLEA